MVCQQELGVPHTLKLKAHVGPIQRAMLRHIFAGTSSLSWSDQTFFVEECLDDWPDHEDGEEEISDEEMKEE